MTNSEITETAYDDDAIVGTMCTSTMQKLPFNVLSNVENNDSQ